MKLPEALEADCSRSSHSLKWLEELPEVLEEDCLRSFHSVKWLSKCT
jgi:hypothetical protein